MLLRYKALWAKQQKRKRGIPSWQTALAFRNSKVPLVRPVIMGRSNSLSSSSSSSAPNSRSISECWTPDIILEEAEEDLELEDSGEDVGAESS